MAKITAPVPGFKGKVAGVVFKNGKAETDDDNAIAYFRRKGYGIGSSAPTGTGAGKDGAEPADPREVTETRVGQPLRDAAVDPRESDFLAPKNAGEANPHGPEVVSPGIHGNQGVRPVKPGDVHVGEPDTQDDADGTPVSDGPQAPAGNASRDDWAAYVTALGEDPGDRGRDELRDTYGPQG